jgi:hypothetical protein
VLKFVMGMSFIFVLLTFKYLSQRYRRVAAASFVCAG